MMKAFVTSVGERTTAACCRQLSRYGFDVTLLDEDEPWAVKYQRFLHAASGQDCVRVDADVVPNASIGSSFRDFMVEQDDKLMAQGTVFDFYTNAAKVGQPVFYRASAFPLILGKLHEIDRERPESWAWRLPEVNPHTFTYVMAPMGMHGFFQDEEAVTRTRRNRKERRHEFDEALVLELTNLSK